MDLATVTKLAANSPYYVITVLFILLLWTSHTWKDRQLQIQREDFKEMLERHDRAMEKRDQENKELRESLARLADQLEKIVEENERTNERVDKALERLGQWYKGDRSA